MSVSSQNVAICDLVPYVPGMGTRGAPAACEDVERHLRWCERRGLRRTTMATRRGVLGRLARTIGCCPCEATRAQIDVWWDAHPASAAARAVDLSHVRSFYGWAIDDELRPDDPSRHLPMPRRKKGIPRPVSEDELERAIGLATDRVRPWLVLAGFAGLRGAEIAQLRGEDVDFDRGVLIVADGKGGKQRVVPMHPRVRQVLADVPSRGPVFRQRSGEQITPGCLQTVASDFLLGIGCRSTLHAFRHRFGTRLYETTRDLRLVQEMLGHASPATTAVYTAWSPDAAAAGIGEL